MMVEGVAFYLVPLGAIVATYVARRRRIERRSAAVLDEANAAGLTEPASLHPVIDPNLCIGCQSCMRACPEGDVLGLIDGKARLVNPTHCIGHGACRDACPTRSIELVFGTAVRGIDIPFVDQQFQTNVPGIFIAGELGGMGLIRNAVTQGCQAIDGIARNFQRGDGDMLDVVIVGAGPAGFAASLAAMKRRLKAVTIEQETLGGSVSHYPRAKIVMNTAVDMPLYGKLRLSRTTKERLLEVWKKIEAKTGVPINYQEGLQSIVQIPGGFEVVSTKATYRSRTVLLAIGRRGTPRKLGVPGEELPKVVYRLDDPGQYRGQRVLVAGGGDSAIEAACAIAEEPGTRVTLSYRGEAFSRAKPANLQRIDQAARQGRIDVLFGSNLSRIYEQAIVLERDGEPLRMDNDAVIVCAGGVLPTAFLQSIGIAVETKFGTA